MTKTVTDVPIGSQNENLSDFAGLRTLSSTIALVSVLNSHTRGDDQLPRASKNLLEAIFDSLDEAVFLVKGHDRAIVTCNSAAERIFGYKPRELIGSTSEILFCNREDYLGFGRIRNCALEEGLPFCTRYRMCRRDGREIETEHTVTALANDAGRDLEAVSVVRDVTEQVASERALRDSEEKYRNLLDHAAESIVVVQDGLLAFANPQVASITGYLQEDLVGVSVEQLIHEEDFPLVESMINRLIDGRSIPRDIEFRTVSRQGQISWLRTNAVELTWEGRPAVMALMTDVTEQKRLQEKQVETENQLLQVQKAEAIGTLAGGIAHDFNNILGAIIGYTDIALEKAAGHPSISEPLSNVLQAAGRAKDLVAQILTFSRGTGDNPAPIAVGIIAKEVAKLLRATIPHQISVRSDIEANCVVMADPSKIHQLLMNLCVNAYQAMQQNGGDLMIRVRKTELDAIAAKSAGLAPGGHVQLTVSDTGEGIDESIQHLIFDPYFTTKKPGEGTGMGLAVVFGIVRSMGGAIQVSSTPGQGTTFTVLMPWVELPDSTNTEDPSALETGDERILVVDDEAPLVNIYVKLLQRLGYHVEGYTDPAEALKRFNAAPHDFDLVISDLMMPQISGETLAQRMTETRSDIPIIVSTGYAQWIDSETWPRFGVCATLQKPLTKEYLARKVRQVLDSHR